MSSPEVCRRPCERHAFRRVAAVPAAAVSADRQMWAAPGTFYGGSVINSGVTGEPERGGVERLATRVLLAAAPLAAALALASALHPGAAAC